MLKSTEFSGNPPDELYAKLGSDGFWNKFNNPFLDAAIERGYNILMATKVNNNTLYTNLAELTGYEK